MFTSSSKTVFSLRGYWRHSVFLTLPQWGWDLSKPARLCAPRVYIPWPIYRAQGARLRPPVRPSLPVLKALVGRRERVFGVAWRAEPPVPPGARSARI